MSDLICRKTMMRCMTPGMCSPFGGCRDSATVNPGAPLPGTILAADHDRIVSALIAGREAAERENESLRSKARASEQAALELRAEVERLQRELGTAHADASHYASTAKDLRAEGERLRKDAELGREMQRAASELPDGWEIRVCVERGAGWVELTNQDGEGIADTWSGQESLSCEISDAIDAALEAAR